MPVNFYTVLCESAAARGEVAIGYRLYQFRDDSEKYYGVTVNPDKLGKIVFNKNDSIIVLTED